MRVSFFQKFTQKKTIIAIGVFLFFLLLSEFVYALIQPVVNLGFKFDPRGTEFYVYKDERHDNPAAKIKTGYYHRINDLTIQGLIDYKQEHGEYEYKKHFGSYFEYGKPIRLYDDENRLLYAFTFYPISLIKCYRTISLFVKIKFSIALVMILTGIIIMICMKSDKITKPLIYILYFLGITIANVFDSEFSSPHFAKVSAAFLDFGLFFSLTCVFQYFSSIFKIAKFKNPFKILKFIPISFLIIKYIIIVILKWDIVSNPLQNVTAPFLCICFGTFLLLFLMITIKLPKSLTVTFRFFVLGLAFAVIPLLIEHFSFLLSKSVFMTEKEKIYSVIACGFIPSMVTLAFLHDLKLLRSRIIFWITSYFAYIIIYVPTIGTIMNYLEQSKLEMFSIGCMLVTPFFFILIYNIVKKLFSLDENENKKILDTYKNKITNITDTLLLHEVTTEEIKTLLQCSYVFFYKKSKHNTWDLQYSWGDVNPKTREEKLQEVITKKRTYLFKDGSFSVPILRESYASGIVVIGPKLNTDQYLPGEHILVEQMLHIFHKHYLMYTNNKLLNDLESKTQTLLRIQTDTIFSMANLIESRDGGTGAHVKRTADYSALIAKKAMEEGLFPEEINNHFIQLLKKSAPMHDIGKIVVPDNVLKKPGKLTSEEFEQMKQHTTEGERIVKEVLSSSGNDEYINMTSEIAQYHHEWWNGTGYPAGLKSEEIPLCARILALADVFDALVSPRCYKEPMSPEKAFEIIEKESGTHFDPVLADLFLRLKDDAIATLNKNYL